MSLFKTSIVACNPKREELVSTAIEALVDTGSELTWLPRDVLLQIGITPRRKKLFVTADGTRIERPIGYAILRADNLTLLGVRTLEGFGVMVDNIGHRLVASTTIVA
jgi:predicted aspartyl protease